MTDETSTTTSEDDAERRRTRTRTRTRRVERDGESGRATTTDDRREEPARADQAVVRRRRRRRADQRPAAADRGPVRDVGDVAGRKVPGGVAAGSDDRASDDRASDDRASDDGQRPSVRRRRRGSRGGRGGARRERAGAGTDAAPAAEKPPEDATAEARVTEAPAAEATADAPAEAPVTEAPATEAPAAEATAEVAVTEAPATEADEAVALAGQPTRLQTKARARGRGRPRSRRGRKPGTGVSEETRRTIAESPPRRMLVQVGDDRTQIAVLEERSLVEHYVTRRADVSYVGNIYLGRVQNVLPGMEAAFVDIGKGRNGVLYAGEVNYDEADLEGDLPRIEQTLKPGQTVLVQVTKDPMGTKGARLTQHLSVAGRYCVLAPGDGMLGISRKLPDDERERLRKLLKELKPEGFGLIVRTAAEGVTREQLDADIRRLTRIWETVQEQAKTVKPLEPVYEEPNLVMRVIRDVFGTEYSDLVIDDAALAEEIRGYLGDVAPDMAGMVQVYDGDERIFDAYEVTTQVRRALEKKVWLKSGGYLIIEKTEAMWVVDVNTGKFVGEDNLEETVLRNNLEAAEEIARQLRLRDMGGIIVIDFVDMLVPANRDEVLKRFKRELARDKTKSRVMDISRLGLVQMTRKNVSQGVFENFTTRCETCEGRGARILDEAFR